MKATYAVGLVVLVTLAAVAACGADPPCVLGVRGWCENEMAALAVRTAGAPAASRAASIIVVTQDFALDAARFGGAAVREARPDQVESLLISPSRAADDIAIVISEVRVINAPGYGAEAASGSALVTIYQGQRKLHSETVRGVLVNGKWTQAGNRQ